MNDLPMPEIDVPQKKENLYAEFYLRAEQNNPKTIEEGRPIFEEKEYVKIMVPGDKTCVIERPVRLGSTERHDNVRFAVQYQAFKQKKDQQPEGTPLKEWPLISSAQVKELEHFNVQTVEQLAAMPDTACQNFQGVFALREQAKSYLERAKEEAPAVQLKAAIQEKDDQLAAMQQQMEAMQEELRALKKPRRGRPPKNGD